MKRLLIILSGLILSDMVTKNRREFERNLYDISSRKRELMKAHNG